MQVVLLENVKKLGKKLDTVDVSEGYARNYLIPRKLAKIASNQTVAETKGQKSAIEFKKQTKKEEALKIKETLEKQTFNFKLKAQNGKFFGSITAKEIADEVLAKLNIILDRKKIDIQIPIKSAGIYSAKIKLFEGVVANIKVKVEEE